MRKHSNTADFGQHVLDMEARLVEGTIDLPTLRETWAVYADLLEETCGSDHWRTKRAAKFAQGNSRYEVIEKFELCLEKADILWTSYFWPHPPHQEIYKSFGKPKKFSCWIIPSSYFEHSPENADTST